MVPKDKKLCPLLAASSSSKVPTNCVRDECAWWDPEHEICAVRSLGIWANQKVFGEY